MHAVAFVLLPGPPASLEEATEMVEKLMAPHREEWDETTRETTGFWDYWRIGGRWGGYLEYAPGQVGGFVGPTGWDSPEDGVDPARHVDVAALGMIAELKLPYTVVTGEGVRHREDWDTFPDDAWREGVTEEERHRMIDAWRQECHERFDPWWDGFSAGLGPDVWIAVVDYHT